MLKVGIQAATRHKILVFEALRFDLEQNLAIFGVDEADARVISGHHDAVGHYCAAHELDSSDLFAL